MSLLDEARRKQAAALAEAKARVVRKPPEAALTHADEMARAIDRHIEAFKTIPGWVVWGRTGAYTIGLPNR